MVHLLAAALAASSLALPALLAPAALCAVDDMDAVMARRQDAAEDEKPIHVETSSCLVLEGQNVAIVTTKNGLVRRVELEALEATAETRDHDGTKRPPLVKEIEGGQLVTLDVEGEGYLRSSETLEPLGRYSVGPGYGLSAIHPTGMSIARVRNRREVAISVLGESSRDPVVLKCASRVRDLAYSPDGTQLVVLVTNGYHFIDRSELSEIITVPVAMEPCIVEFIGEDKLAIGSGNGQVEAPVEVLIVEARTGAQQRVIRASVQAAPLGGFVSSLDFHPESGRLIFGISSAGSVLAVDPDSGQSIWHISFGGGNPGGIGVVHPKGSKRCFSQGMTHLHRAAFSWDTGKNLSSDRLHGYSYLTGTSDDRYTIGIQHGRLIRVDSETYHAELRRIEYAKPLAGSVAVFSKPR